LPQGRHGEEELNITNNGQHHKIINIIIIINIINIMIIIMIIIIFIIISNIKSTAVAAATPPQPQNHDIPKPRAPLP
jgi:hypothetical protein